MLKMKFIFWDSYFLKSALTTLMIKTMLMYSHNALFFLLFFLKAKCTYKKLNIADSQCIHRGKYSYEYKYMTCIYGIVAHVYSAATVNALVSPTLDLAEFVSSL